MNNNDTEKNMGKVFLHLKAEQTLPYYINYFKMTDSTILKFLQKNYQLIHKKNNKQKKCSQHMSQIMG